MAGQRTVVRTYGYSSHYERDAAYLASMGYRVAGSKCVMGTREVPQSRWPAHWSERINPYRTYALPMLVVTYEYSGPGEPPRTLRMSPTYRNGVAACVFVVALEALLVVHDGVSLLTITWGIIAAFALYALFAAR